jgi:hypothetical protein
MKGCWPSRKVLIPLPTARLFCHALSTLGQTHLIIGTDIKNLYLVTGFSAHQKLEGVMPPYSPMVLVG